MPVFHPTTHKVLLGFSLFHLLLAASLPLTLFETHYALYGVHLQWSYVDHPPLIGWLQALVQLVSHADLAQRLIPVLLTLATQYLLALIALRLFTGVRQLDTWTALVAQLLPVSHIVFMAAPDLPLALCSLAAFWFCLNLLHQSRTRDWLLLGACFGLAGLSKYTAVTLALSLAILFTRQQRGPGWLLTPGLWLAALVGALVIAPVLLWNYQHDWISFSFQLAYQAGEGWSLANMVEALGGQLAAYSPLILLALLPVPEPHREAARRLQIWAAPLLLLFVYQSGAGRSAPHWTYSAWLLLVPLVALQLQTLWTRRWLRFSLYGWSGLLSLGLVFALLVPHLSYRDFKHPLAKISGWPEASAQAQTLAQAWEKETGKTVTLAVQNWHHAEPLAWYARPLAVRGTRGELSQYSQWFGHFQPGDLGLLVVPGKKTDAPEVTTTGASCQWHDSLPVTVNRGIGQVFHFYRCQW